MWLQAFPIATFKPESIILQQMYLWIFISSEVPEEL